MQQTVKAAPTKQKTKSKTTEKLSHKRRDFHIQSGLPKNCYKFEYECPNCSYLHRGIVHSDTETFNVVCKQPLDNNGPPALTDIGFEKWLKDKASGKKIPICNYVSEVKGIYVFKEDGHHKLYDPKIDKDSRFLIEDMEQRAKERSRYL